jgi:hypothetical protein
MTQGYEERLMDEYADLEERTEKLSAYVDSDAYFKEVSVQDRDYLVAQLAAQRELLRILTSRVAIVKEKKPAPKVEKEPVKVEKTHK